jgi:hypothetical protein
MQDHLDMTVMHPPFRLRTGSQRQIVRGRPKPRGSSVWRMDIPGQTDHVHDLASDGEVEGGYIQDPGATGGERHARDYANSIFSGTDH